MVASGLLLVYQANLEVVKVSALQLILEFVEFSTFFLLSHIGLSHDDRVDVPIKKCLTGDQLEGE